MALSDASLNRYVFAKLDTKDPIHDISRCSFVTYCAAKEEIYEEHILFDRSSERGARVGLICVMDSD